MTTLRKLGIRGVRSYSGSEEESIEFLKPITIIVGSNGAGKTSIIEALKYITTGTLPPLSDGGKSFVHDPKMDGTNLIKAQIKLSFLTPDNQQVLAIRNFQLSQKKSKREFKGMEAVISTKDAHGHETSVSHKCVDMEKLVPQLLGVSPAVLENVIFVHQEDSLWPLSDPKTLKMKFDDIFAATRYTKALENIHKLRKEKVNEIKVMEADLRTLQNNMESAHKMEDDLENTKNSIKEKTNKIEAINEKIKTFETKLRSLSGKQDDIRNLQDTISSLVAQKELLVVERNKSRDRMKTDYSDSDEELKQIYVTFRSSVVQLLKTIEEKQNNYNKLDVECIRNEQLMRSYAEDLGKLQAQENEYKIKKQQLTECATKYGVSLSSPQPSSTAAATSSSSSSNYASLLQTIQTQLTAKQNEYQNIRAEGSTIDSKYELELNNLRKEENAISEGIKFKYQSMETCKSKKSRLLKEMNDIEIANRSMVNIEEQLKKQNENLEQILKTVEPNNVTMKSTIETHMRTIANNTQKLSVLSTQRKQLSSQSELLAQIKLKRTQLQTLCGQYQNSLEELKIELEEKNLWNQEQVNTSTTTTNTAASTSSSSSSTSASSLFPKSLPSFDRLKEIFDPSSSSSSSSASNGGNTTPNSRLLDYQLDRLELHFKQSQQALKQQFKIKSEQLNACTGHLSSLQSQRKSMEQNLQSCQAQLNSYEAEFRSAGVLELFHSTNEKEMEEAVAKSSRIFEKANQEYMLGPTAKVMYKKFINIAQEKHLCYLCNRNFSNNEEEKSFITVNTDKMDKISNADKIDRMKSNMQSAKQHMETMQGLAKTWQQVQKIRQEEIPKWTRNMETLNVDINIQQNQKTNDESELKLLKEKEDSYFDVLRTIGILNRMFNEIETNSCNLQMSEKKLQIECENAAAALGSSSPKSLETVINEYESIERTNVNLQRECNALQDALEKARNEKQKIIDSIQKLKEQVNEMHSIGEKKNQLLREQTENENIYQSLKIEVTKLSDQLPNLKQRISTLVHEREEARHRSSQNETTANESVLAIQREYDAIKTVVEACERYEKQVRDRVEMKKELTNKQEMLNTLRTERSKLKDEIKADQERLTQNEKIDADIQANLEYRQRDKAVTEQQKKIDEQMNALRVLSGGSLIEDLRKLETELITLKEKRSEYRGAIASEGKHADEINENLTSDTLRHIDKRYKNKLIEVKTTQLATQDLDTYYRALDKALMHFHSIKMKEINETLKDYWRMVYKGTDIDEIYIVSDGAVIGNKRNYNYRVVMKQGDTELDMRGRCSAGQKVLASLLIRLALADTFCSKCAVLALDEPTTNLDHRNITAFAQALNQIIEKRREQSNFQLIIITHDEAFVDEIGKRAHAEYYYRVYKDNAQHSKIRKQVIEQEDEH